MATREARVCCYLPEMLELNPQTLGNDEADLSHARRCLMRKTFEWGAVFGEGSRQRPRACEDNGVHRSSEICGGARAICNVQHYLHPLPSPAMLETGQLGL